METPTLNKKQQKSSLSSKKVRPKEIIKNVLSTPYTLYWPEITPEDHNVLQQILLRYLPKIKQKVSIPWQDLKSIPKSERKKFREEYAKDNQMTVNKNDRKGVTIGANNVTKLLEKSNIHVVLISHDVQPKLMVQHIIDQAVLYSVPVLIFKNLRNVLNEICGVSSAVLGISKEIESESNLNLIKDCITQIFQKCPQPINHINYNRSLENEVVIVSDIPKNKPMPTENKVDEEEIRQSVYLKRDSKNKRIFIPPYRERTSRNYIMEVDSEGFMPLSLEPENTVKETVQTSYKSLVVKRLKGDRNRNTRKITNLKRKLK